MGGGIGREALAMLEGVTPCHPLASHGCSAADDRTLRLRRWARHLSLSQTENHPTGWYRSGGSRYARRRHALPPPCKQASLCGGRPNPATSSLGKNPLPKPKRKPPEWVVFFLAQREGFEPSCDCSQTDFESAPL